MSTLSSFQVYKCTLLSSWQDLHMAKFFKFAYCQVGNSTMSSFQVHNSKFSNLSNAHCQVPQAHTCKLISLHSKVSKCTFPNFQVSPLPYSHIANFYMHLHIVKFSNAHCQVHLKCGRIAMLESWKNENNWWLQIMCNLICICDVVAFDQSNNELDFMGNDKRHIVLSKVTLTQRC